MVVQFGVGILPPSTLISPFAYSNTPVRKPHKNICGESGCCCCCCCQEVVPSPGRRSPLLLDSTIICQRTRTRHRPSRIRKRVRHTPTPQGLGSTYPSGTMDYANFFYPTAVPHRHATAASAHSTAAFGAEHAHETMTAFNFAHETAASVHETVAFGAAFRTAHAHTTTAFGAAQPGVLVKI